MIEIFLISFIIAFSGALVPGPVTTFTIYKSLEEERGYLAGIFVSLGHATIEFALILFLILGLALFIQNLMVLMIIGIAGGILLVLFGILVIRDASKEEMKLNFSVKDEDIEGFKGNSFVGGMVLSLSNPYWALWWAIVGLGLMIRFNLLDFSNPTGLILFFIGHELGDVVVLCTISVLAYKGGESIKADTYKKIIKFCGIFMICFGVYLAGSIILFPPEI